MSININEILDLGKKIIVEGGTLTLPYFTQYQNRYAEHSNAHVDRKADNSPVTEADRETELWMRKKLLAHFPDFGIIGEEFDDVQGLGEYSWVIDPIDGTRAFITGVPLYTTLLGLINAKTHEPIAGFIYAPVTKELIYAGSGMGAWYNDTPTKVAPINDISEATIVSYDWDAAYKKAPQLLEMNTHAENVRTWGDGYGYMLLGSGRVHAVVDVGMHMWDIIPVYPIIKEAGGVVSSWTGAIDWFSHDVDCIAATNKLLLDTIRKNV